MALKSALERAMEKSDTLIEKKDVIKYTDEQKRILQEIRQKYQSKIAEEEIMAQTKMKQIPPEELAQHHSQFQTEIARMRHKYTEQMENEINQKIQEFKN